MKRAFAVVLGLLALVLILLGIWDFHSGHLTQTITVTVPEGAGLFDIADLVSDAVYPVPFRLYVTVQGAESRLRAGTYTIEPGTGYRALLDLLISGVPEESIRFTIPEGYELREIRTLLAEYGIVSEEEFTQAVLTFDAGEYDFLKDIPEGETRLEGFLFPDTYEVFAGESAESILRRMLDRFDEIYTQEYATRAKELGMSCYEVVTLASIIEREAAKADEQAHVSSVFHNRLSSREYPYLESCATVQYILKERKAVLSVADTKIDSPYNTYRYPGLPKGPIASPGAGAIYAALYPSDDDDYFFFAQPDGTHVFSKTYEEHLRAQGR